MWHDSNGNQGFDLGEGVPGFTVFFDGNNDGYFDSYVDGSTVTDGNGFFSYETVYSKSHPSLLFLFPPLPPNNTFFPSAPYQLRIGLLEDDTGKWLQASPPNNALISVSPLDFDTIVFFRLDRNLQSTPSLKDLSKHEG